jgi:hypothetical protein
VDHAVLFCLIGGKRSLIQRRADDLLIADKNNRIAGFQQGRSRPASLEDFMWSFVPAHHINRCSHDASV